MHRITTPQNRICTMAAASAWGRNAIMQFDAVFTVRLKLIQQHHLRPHVGEQHLEDEQVQHRGHPQRHAHIGALLSILKQKYTRKICAVTTTQ